MTQPQSNSEESTRFGAMPTLWLAILLIIFDQLTKAVANHYLVFGEPLAIIPHLNLTLVYNYGAAFSFLADMGGWQKWFFSFFGLLVSVGLMVWLAKMPRAWTVEVVAINFILSGAIGNVIDRMIEGRVTDFVDFYIGTWHYATFNVADIAISLGAGLFILSEFWLKPRAEKRTQQGKKAKESEE